MGGARRYQRGVFDPHQEMLPPPRVAGFVDANNPVRAIAAYVEACDLAALDFKHATGGGGGGRGQPAYDPRDLLKLYLSGYMNRVRSSRGLEVECRRQLEALKAQVAETQATIKTLEEHGETQLSHTDPDARRLRKNAKSVVGYNVQISVDDQHKLILDAELTNAGNDQGQLAGAIERCGEALCGNVAPRASAATEAPASASPAVSGESSRAANAQAPVAACAAADQAPVDTEASPAAPVYVADSGYYTDADIGACAAQGVVIYVPTPTRPAAPRPMGASPAATSATMPRPTATAAPTTASSAPAGSPRSRTATCAKPTSVVPRTATAARCVSSACRRRATHASSTAASTPMPSSATDNTWPPTRPRPRSPTAVRCASTPSASSSAGWAGTTCSCAAWRRPVASSVCSRTATTSKGC
jgi:hypothetical protein